MPGRVGEQVAQDLYDPSLIRHHRWQVRRQVNLYDVPFPTAQERVPRLVHHRGHLGRFGIHRKRARLDASNIKQVLDDAVHVIGLLLDNPEELTYLCRVREA